MSPVAEQLLEAALALPEEERLELVEALLASQDSASGQPPFDPDWLGEIQRRSAEIETGMVQLTPWPVVRERARQRLKGQVPQHPEWSTATTT